MSLSSLDSKTIRPGSLGSYSYYHSARRAPEGQSLEFPKLRLSFRHKSLYKKLALTAVVLAALIVLPLIRSYPSSPKTASASPPPAKTAPAAATSSSGPCKSNTSAKEVLVSISARHLWACSGQSVAYNSPVVTGMEMYPDTLTPTGTYYIFAKQTNLTLSGTDSAGSWSDPVEYWMPFLSNQYGTYGLHDATWRPASQFGSVSPNSSQASNGCVELPLATAKWLYGWTDIGTAVVIKS